MKRRDYLAHHDHPCPDCEYNLRGTPGLVCPECGCKTIWREQTSQLGWHLGRSLIALTTVLLLVLVVCSVLKASITMAAVSGLTLFGAPSAWTRWNRTRRAFCALPEHIRQQLVAKWALAALLAAAMLVLVWRIQ